MYRIRDDVQLFSLPAGEVAHVGRIRNAMAASEDDLDAVVAQSVGKR